MSYEDRTVRFEKKKNHVNIYVHKLANTSRPQNIILAGGTMDSSTPLRHRNYVTYPG